MVYKVPKNLLMHHTACSLVITVCHTKLMRLLFYMPASQYNVTEIVLESVLERR